jgi:hypothetical protein
VKFETDLFSPARDDAERITATDVMMNISKKHAKTSHGMKNGCQRLQNARDRKRKFSENHRVGKN